MSLQFVPEDRPAPPMPSTESAGTASRHEGPHPVLFERQPDGTIRATCLGCGAEIACKAVA